MTKDLEIKVRRMWKAGIKIVPVINGALGTIKKGLDQNLQLLPGDPVNHRVTEDNTSQHCTHHFYVPG